jgi:hypothetical protein
MSDIRIRNSLFKKSKISLCHSWGAFRAESIPLYSNLLIQEGHHERRIWKHTVFLWNMQGSKVLAHGNEADASIECIEACNRYRKH